jgi:hypothetical protein
MSPVARVDSEHKNHRGGVTVYPDSGQSVPYVQQLMVLILKSTQNLEGYNIVYRKKREIW